MPFYLKIGSSKKRESRIVSQLSNMICKVEGVWEIRANDIIESLGEPSDSKLFLVQREGKPNEEEFEVVKFIGYTYQEDSGWWAPLVIQGIDGDQQLVHCFVYIVSESPNTFAESHIYGPNFWPEALITICERALADVKHEILRRKR